MAKRRFHTKLRTKVYHDDDECTKGNNIEQYNKILGSGGLRLCKECKDKPSKRKRR